VLVVVPAEGTDVERHPGGNQGEDEEVEGRGGGLVARGRDLAGGGGVCVFGCVAAEGGFMSGMAVGGWDRMWALGKGLRWRISRTASGRYIWLSRLGT